MGFYLSRNIKGWQLLMIYKEDSILINQDLSRVFQVACDIERLSSFIPEYKNVQCLDRKDGEMILAAKIQLLGFIPITFISSGIIKENESIKYEQIKGPLKGLQTEWRFEEVDKKTKLIIIHTLNIKIPLVGNLIEKLVYTLFIKNLAQEVLLCMKKEVE